MIDKKVEYNSELIKGMIVESTIFSAVNEEIGIALLSEVVGGIHVLRIYQLMFSVESESYTIVQELAAFSFVNRYELESFIKGLPELSGLEMLIMLNPLPEEIH